MARRRTSLLRERPRTSRRNDHRSGGGEGRSRPRGALSRRSPKESQHLFAIEDERGETIGRLFFETRPSGVWLYEIELEERVRGRGLGREAMLAFEEHARELGAVKVTLNVFGGNEIARSLYRSLGYVEEAVNMGKRLV